MLNFAVCPVGDWGLGLVERARSRSPNCTPGPSHRCHQSHLHHVRGSTKTVAGPRNRRTNTHSCEQISGTARAVFRHRLLRQNKVRANTTAAREKGFHPGRPCLSSFHYATACTSPHSSAPTTCVFVVFFFRFIISARPGTAFAALVPWIGTDLFSPHRRSLNPAHRHQPLGRPHSKLVDRCSFSTSALSFLPSFSFSLLVPDRARAASTLYSMSRSLLSPLL